MTGPERDRAAVAGARPPCQRGRPAGAWPHDAPPAPSVGTCAPGPPEGRIARCAIVTCEANATLAPIHERMPVIIAPADFALWLGEAGTGAARLMVPAPDGALYAAPADAVTRAILARRAGAPGNPKDFI